MTAGELIEALRQFDPGSRVVTHAVSEGGYDEVAQAPEVIRVKPTGYESGSIWGVYQEDVGGEACVLMNC